MNILVTGGAGYIGSFMTKRLLQEGYSVTVLDSLERGHKEAVDSKAELQIGKLHDESFLENIFNLQKFDAIIHFAGYISMEESMRLPEIYFQNNTFATLNLIKTAQKYSVNKIIFSSTAGVYGNPVITPIPEDHPKNPENPYGESKLMVESILKWFNKVHGLNSVSLRYFNACGASIDSSMGEGHDPETHIIPKAIDAVLSNKPFKLFGTNYKTKDGTCVRDYIHVLDLTEAHILALKKLNSDKGNFCYNVGTGTGYSNKEIVEAVRRISGGNLEIQFSERRPGDADELVADASRIKEELKFHPSHSDIDTIVSSAWKWHKKNNL